MCNILVYHNSIEHLAFLEDSARDLFDLRVALDFKVQLVEVASSHDVPGGLECEATDKLAPSMAEFRADAGVQSLHDLVVIGDVNGD